ncbi:MAG: acyl carrier protein [Asgard group archaeon]|nr:acyl carrier protein [Asgard group archaeon]
MSELKNKIYDIINKTLLIEKDKINDSLSMNDVEEWDSMAHLIIVSEIEQTFEIILEDDDIPEMTSVANILTTLGKYEVG